MWKVCILNSVAPKLQPQREKLTFEIANWYTDGYRTSAPGTNLCQVNTDCEGDEICQGGFCAYIGQGDYDPNRKSFY